MRILFLSRRNAGRSVLAESLARQLLGTEHAVTSAGLEPGPVHPAAAAVMREVAIDVSTHAPRQWAREELGGYDLVVVVCERDLAGPLPKGVRKLHWPIMDPLDPPAGEAVLLERFRDVRTALDKHIKALGKMRLERQTG